MVGMHGGGKDDGSLQTAFQVGGGHIVVDAPAQVLFPGVGPEAPPGVLSGFVRMEMAESVNIAALDELLHPCALFRKEARVGGVANGVVDVNGAVADVVVAAKDQAGPFLLQLLHVLLEIVQPLHFKGLAFVSAGSGRMVDTDHGKVSVIGADKAPFRIVGGDAHARHNLVRFLAGEYGHAAVAFFLGGKTVAAIANGFEFQNRNLVWLRLGLLYAEHIRHGLLKPFHQAFPYGGPYAVDIIGDDFHGFPKKGGWVGPSAGMCCVAFCYFAIRAAKAME